MTTLSSSRSASSSLRAGIVAGLAGGLVFGVMMGMMGMLPMVGMLIRVENGMVGFFVHMAISAGLGALYGLLAPRLPQGTAAAVVAGVVYGIVWWVLGALILMPLMLGMNDMLFVIGGMQWSSLLGHIIFGVITALLFAPLQNRL